jgi:hypothetical protein
MDDINDAPARRKDEFDIERSTCILPARTDVLAYVDDRGDLWIYGQDSVRRCDTELRINAEDVPAFVDRLTDLVGIPSIGKPVSKPKAKSGNAERQRRHRAKKRNGVTPHNVTPRNARNVTRNAQENLDLAPKRMAGE